MSTSEVIKDRRGTALDVSPKTTKLKTSLTYAETACSYFSDAAVAICSPADGVVP